MNGFVIPPPSRFASAGLAAPSNIRHDLVAADAKFLLTFPKLQRIFLTAAEIRW